jgi:hypothetical protein
MSQLYEEEEDGLNSPALLDEQETSDNEHEQLYVNPRRRQFTDKLFIFLYWLCFIAMISIGFILVGKKTVSLSVAKSLFLPLWNSAGKFNNE